MFKNGHLYYYYIYIYYNTVNYIIKSTYSHSTPPFFNFIQFNFLILLSKKKIIMKKMHFGGYYDVVYGNKIPNNIYCLKKNSCVLYEIISSISSIFCLRSLE